MIPQEYTSTLFNPISFHDPYFDRVPGADEFQLSKDIMFNSGDNNNNNSTFPSTYPAFRRMSADTQASSNDSSSAAAYPSPDHKSEKMNNGVMNGGGGGGGGSSSVVLPPIHDLGRPTSPETSDASSTTRSPQWPHHQQQQVAHHHQHQHQHQQHQHYSPPHHQSPAYNFPPIDHHSRRPQLHINPPPDHQRVHVASYPTPTTASTMSNYSSSSSSYNPYPNTASRDHTYRPAPGNSVAPPPPPVVTPATLAAAVGTQQRRRGKLPKPVTEFLKKWLLAHTDHPYPTEDEKKWLCSETGLSMSQVSNWMINVRVFQDHSTHVFLILYPTRLVVVFWPQQPKTPLLPLQLQLRAPQTWL
jgi:Homeobox KN domain